MTGRQLLAGERILYDARPHALYFFLPLTGALPGAAFLVAHWRTEGLWADTFRVLLLAWSTVWTPVLLWHLGSWWFTRCTVSNFRVTWRRGVLSREGVEIPVERISNVNFHQTLLERVFGAGDLVIESSGQDGRSRFSDIRHPERVQTLIQQAIVAGPSETAAARATGLDDLGRLTALLDRGVLTDEEFATIKKRLLDG